MDRARAIAESLLAALAAADPAAAAARRRAAHELGETWLGGAVELEAPEGLVSVPELARRMGVRVTTVHDWCSRGLGPGVRRGEGRRLTRYPGGVDPVEAAQLVAWARDRRAHLSR